jgi:hypothetical protein
MENGHPGLRHLLHELVIEASASPEATGYVIQVLPTLVNEYGFDVNCMRQNDAYTPLHLACRLGNLPAFKVLILLGADIHAVANDDSLPLVLARRCTESATRAQQVVDSGEIVKFLTRLGASETITFVNATG